MGIPWCSSFASRLASLPMSLAVHLVFLALFLRPVHSFWPTAQYGHTGAIASAFDPDTFSFTSTPAQGGPYTYTFTSAAIQQMQSGIVDVDTHAWTAAHSSYHFDDEQFSASSAQIAGHVNDLLRELGTAVIPGAGGSYFQSSCSKAQNDLGRILHTVQDFYAHSNWARISSTKVQDNIDSLSDPPAGNSPCPVNPYTLGGSGLTDYTSGYFGSWDGYFNYRKIKSNTAAGKPTSYSDLTCPGTSTPGKCIHGYMIDNGGNPPPSPACDGLNNDYYWRPFNPTAWSDAVKASQDFVTNKVLARITSPNQIQCLMGQGPVVGFVLDNTGSMEDTIAGCEEAINYIIENPLTGTVPPTYVVETFNDPFIGTPYSFASPSAGRVLCQLHQRGRWRRLSRAVSVGHNRSRTGRTAWVHCLLLHRRHRKGQRSAG